MCIIPPLKGFIMCPCVVNLEISSSFRFDIWAKRRFFSKAHKWCWLVAIVLKEKLIFLERDFLEKDSLLKLLTVWLHFKKQYGLSTIHQRVTLFPKKWSKEGITLETTVLIRTQEVDSTLSTEIYSKFANTIYSYSRT